MHLPLLRRFVGSIVGECAEACCRDGNWTHDLRQFADARQEPGLVDESLEGGESEGARKRGGAVLRLAHALHGLESSGPARWHMVVEQANDVFVQLGGLVTRECGVKSTCGVVIHLGGGELVQALEPSDSDAPISAGEIAADTGLRTEMSM